MRRYRVSVYAECYGHTITRTFFFRFTAERFADTFRSVPHHYRVSLERI
jgi:hypothetical protein